MTKDEMNQWLSYHSAAFPDLAEWLNRLPDRQATLEIWQETLADVELADSREATRRMATGKEPALEAYERESTARRIVEIARRVYAGRRHKAEAKTTEYPSYGGAKWSLAGIYHRIMRAIRSGKPTKEILAEIPKNPEGEPRFRCLRCKDLGAVQVWANQSIHAVVKNAEHVPIYSATCRCDCPASGKWAEALAVFSPEQFCLYSSRADRLDELRSWCGTWRDTRVERMPNYEPSFAAWGKG